MIDEKEIMPLNYFKYGGIYSGEHKGMRYLIKKIGEKPDFKLAAFLWQGPFAYDATPQEKVTSNEFDLSEEGRSEAIQWLITVYEERITEWESAPSILDAYIDLEKMYS